MSKVYTSIDQLIGHTPLLELTHFEADEDLKARVLVKLEYFNPATPASASPRWRPPAATR